VPLHEERSGERGFVVPVAEPPATNLGTVPRSRHWAGAVAEGGGRGSWASLGCGYAMLLDQVEGSTLPETAAARAWPPTPAGLPRWRTATAGVSGRRLIVVCLLLWLFGLPLVVLFMPVMVTGLVGSGGLARRALCLRPVCTVFSPDLWSFFGGGGTCGVGGRHVVCPSSPSQVRTLLVVLFGVGGCSVGHGWVLAPILGSRHDPSFGVASRLALLGQGCFVGTGACGAFGRGA